MAVLSLQAVPPALRPLVRAYLFGYGSAVAPRLLNLLLQYAVRRRRSAEKKLLPSDFTKSKSLSQSAAHILQTGLEPQRFPAFCAVLVGGSSLLQEPIRQVLNSVLSGSSLQVRLRFVNNPLRMYSLRLLTMKQSF